MVFSLKDFETVTRELPKIVIFDFDGTLCDTGPYLTQVWQEFVSRFLKKYGSESPVSALNAELKKRETEWVNITVEDAIAQLIQVAQLPLAGDTVLPLYQASHQSIFATAPVELFPDVEPFLDYLMRNDVKLSILSCTDQICLENIPVVRSLLDKNIIEQQAVIGKTPQREYKPAFSAVKEIFDMYGYTPPSLSSGHVDAAVWVVGDSPMDLTVAKNSGTLPIWIKSGANEIRRQAVEALKQTADNCYPLIEFSSIDSFFETVQTTCRPQSRFAMKY